MLTGVWMPSCTGSVRGGFWEIWKSQLVGFWRPKKKGDFRLLAEALCRVRTWFGADGKVRCISLPYVEKPLNSKVIKRFVPELRSRKCFFVFRDSYVTYMCVMYIMNVLRTGMNMFISHIQVWLCYHITWINCNFTFRSANVFFFLMWR